MANDPQPAADEHPATQSSHIVTLILGEVGRQQEFQVSSQSIALVSRPFEAMLLKHFKQAKPPNGSPWTVLLPEDDPEAFNILSDIIHADLDQLPKEMTLHLFYKTCLLAEKYLMLPVLRKHAPWWYDKLWWNAYRMNGHIEAAEIQERTSIAYMIGDCKALWAGLTYYAYACRLIDDELIHWRKDPFISGEETQSEIGDLAESRKLLTEEQPCLPAICFDVIKAMRLELLEKIMGSKMWLGWLGSVFCFKKGAHSPACKLDQLSELDCERKVYRQIKTAMAEHGVTGKIPFPLAEDWIATVNELAGGINLVPDHCCLRVFKEGWCEPFPLFRRERAASGPPWYWNRYFRIFESTLPEAVYIRPKSRVVEQYKLEIHRLLIKQAGRWLTEEPS